MARKKTSQLSELESQVMEVVWGNAPVTAEGVRLAMDESHGLKDSTVRTLLRRLEEKGFVEHHVKGRTYVYQATRRSQNVATEAVRGIIDRFCGGSVEDLLIGMVDHNMLTSDQLQELAKKVAEAEAKESQSTRQKRAGKGPKRT